MQLIETVYFFFFPLDALKKLVISSVSFVSKTRSPAKMQNHERLSADGALLGLGSLLVFLRLSLHRTGCRCAK